MPQESDPLQVRSVTNKKEFINPKFKLTKDFRLMIGGDNKHLNPHTKYIAETYFYSNICLTVD